MDNDGQGVTQDGCLERVEASVHCLLDFVFLHCAACLSDVNFLVDEGRDAGAGTQTAWRVHRDIRVRVVKGVD